MTDTTTASSSNIQDPPEPAARGKFDWFIAILLIGLFVAAECIGAWHSLPTQIVLDSIGVFFALNVAQLARNKARSVGIVMTALFVMRVAVIALPVTNTSLPTRSAIIGLMSCVVVYLALRTIRMAREADGTNQPQEQSSPNPLLFPLIALLGLPLGWIAFEILTPRPLAIDPVFGTTYVPVIAAIAGLSIGAVGEELLYRRLVLNMAQDAQLPIALTSATLFASTYLGYQEWRMVALTFAVGFVFALIYKRTSSLWPIAMAHAIASTFVYVTLPS